MGDLLKNADSAMYEAKGLGRDNYQFYRRELNSGASERQLLETGLRHAIERNEFELNYQPIMRLATGACSGVEALLRWRHATRGRMPPSEFIGIAEDSRLIVPIGRWVLREACRHAKAWQQARAAEFRLCVNVSAVELRSKEFVAGVAAILAETGFNPGSLELELTETFLMQESKSTDIVLQALKRLGVTLALDDFGTGYSSLSYMRRFPVDTLKVDRSFVRDLITDAADAGVVGAVIQMGKSLHMRVVAEGRNRGAIAVSAGNGMRRSAGFPFQSSHEFRSRLGLDAPSGMRNGTGRKFGGGTMTPPNRASVRLTAGGGQQTIRFPLDHGIALTAQRLEPGPVQHGDLPRW